MDWCLRWAQDLAVRPGPGRNSTSFRIYLSSAAGTLGDKLRGGRLAFVSFPGNHFSGIR